MKTHLLSIASTKSHPASFANGANITEERKAKTDTRTALVTGMILRVGVLLSASIILLGLILVLLQGGLANSMASTLPHTLVQEWTALLAGHADAVIMLGLLLLMVTPVLSVTASAITFALEHDRLYALIAFGVLSILVASFLLGKGGA